MEATRHFSFLDKPLTRDSWLPFGVVKRPIPILSHEMERELKKKLAAKLSRLLAEKPISIVNNKISKS